MVELDNTLAKAKENLSKATELRRKGMLAESIGEYKQSLKIKPDFIGAIVDLAKVYETQKKWGEASKCYQKLIAFRPNNHVGYLKLAKTLKQNKKIYGAIAAYAEAIELKPDLPARVYKDYGDLLIQVNSTNSDAIAAYIKAAEMKQNWGFGFYNKLANLFEKQGNLTEATTYYLKALNLQEDNPQLYFNVGNIYFKQGLLNKAVGNYKRALQLKPDFSNVYHKLGDLFKQRNQSDDAIKCYQKALEIKPDFKTAYRSLGDVLMTQGKQSIAQKCYQKAQ
ncbi:MAG: tetratricopeptide repeat protein [Waterburya sp.]